MVDEGDVDRREVVQVSAIFFRHPRACWNFDTFHPVAT